MIVVWPDLAADVRKMMAGKGLRGVRQVGHIALVLTPTIVAVLIFAAGLVWKFNATARWGGVVLAVVAQIIVPLAPVLRSERRKARQTAFALVPGYEPGQLANCIDVKVEDFGVLPSQTNIAYVKRDNHANTIRALNESSRVLLSGPAMVGKTRSALELVRQKYPKYRLWRPNSAVDVRQILSAGMLPDRVVVFLDDLERFAGADGLSPQHLNQIVSKDRIVVATMRTSELHLMSANNENKPFGWELPHWFGAPVWLGEWSGAELDRVFAEGGEDLRTGAEQFGLGAYLGGGPAVILRLEIAQSDFPDAFLLARLASDWRSAGLEAIPDGVAQVLLPAYAGENRDGTSCSKAITWVLEKVNQHVAIATRTGLGVRVSDFALEHFQQVKTEPPEAFWTEALAVADSEQLLALGSHASVTYGRDDIADRAWSASDSIHAPALQAEALMAKGPEYWDAAESMLRAALVGSIRPSSFVQVSLGVLCEKRAGGPGAYSSEAEELFNIAASAGNATGAFNAAVAIEKSGREGNETKLEIERYLLQALELGHRWAQGRLGKHYFKHGALATAETYLAAAQTSAAQPGAYSQMDVRITYGDLLDKTGRPDEAERVFRAASSTGPDQNQGRLALAIHLANRHTKASTAEAANIARALIGSNHTEAFAFCGSLLHSAGQRDEAVDVLLDGVELEDGESMFNLGQIYVAEGLETPDPDLLESGRLLLSAAANLGQHAAFEPLGELCRVIDNDLDGAVDWYRRALDSGTEVSESNLAAMLIRRGSADDVAEARETLVRLSESDSVQQQPANNNLGQLSLQEGDSATAEMYFRRAARGGRGIAMLNLADLLADADSKLKRLRALYWRLRARIALRDQPQTLWKIDPQGGQQHSGASSRTVYIHPDSDFEFRDGKLFLKGTDDAIPLE